MEPPKFCSDPRRVHSKRQTKFVSFVGTDGSIPSEYHNKYFCFNCLQTLRKSFRAGAEGDGIAPEDAAQGGAAPEPVAEVEQTSQEARQVVLHRDQHEATLRADQTMTNLGEQASTSRAGAEMPLDLAGVADSEGNGGQQRIGCNKQDLTLELPEPSVCSFVSETEPLCDGSKSFLSFTSLDATTQEALLWSLQREKEDRGNFEQSTICKYHLSSRVDGFETATENKKPVCCDPFEDHYKLVTRNLSNANLLTVVKAKRLGKRILLKSPLCCNCRTKINDLLTSRAEAEQENLLGNQETPSPSQSPSGSQDQPTLSGASSHAEALSQSVIREELNSVLNILGLFPLSIPASSGKGVKLAYVKQRLEEINHAVTSRFCRAFCVQKRDLQAADTLKQIMVGSFTNIMESVKEKIKAANRSKSMKLLTLCPDEWNSSYAASFFGVSRYLVDKARVLKAEKGILESPSYASRSRVQPEMLKIVEEFYCDDRYSRQMPGMSDKISMKRGEEYMSKRLVLCNLVELYAAFKKEHPDVAQHIGKSIFISLRPRWCVLAGSSGTHSVCVCVIHQNAKLLLRALKLDPSLRNIIPIAVCDVNQRECMMGVCDHCPSTAAVLDKMMAMLRSTRAEDESEEEFSFYLQKPIEYKQWSSTDRDDFSTKSGRVIEIAELFISKFKKVIRHDFVAKQQSNFIKEEKENLPVNKAIILMDFSMNYTCVVQDAAQQFHWSKKGITLHPVVIYYKGPDGLLKVKSLCFISDDIKHDVTQVRLYQEKSVEYLKENHPEITEVLWVTDGCAGQYKNCTSFYNMCQQARKSGMKITWCFCATSHGKCPCDGIGGLVKREARKASLQRFDSGHILNARQLFEFCKSSNLGETIVFFLVESSEIVIEREYEKNLKAVTVPGTQSLHHFIPVSGTSSLIACKHTSYDTEVSVVHNLMPSEGEEEAEINVEEGSYVAVMVGPKIHIAFVSDVNNEEAEAELSLLYPALPATVFSWSESSLGYFAPICDIVCPVSLIERQDLHFELDMSAI